jgi:hypothetical protein
LRFRENLKKSSQFNHLCGRPLFKASIKSLLSAIALTVPESVTQIQALESIATPSGAEDGEAKLEIMFPDVSCL